MSFSATGLEPVRLKSLRRSCSANNCCESPPRGDELDLTFHPGARSLARAVATCCPSTARWSPETYHLFDDELIGSMKRGSYIVNTARGAIMDRDVVVRALESGQLAGYAGDVWYPHPPSADHPWRTMPHQAMTPHTSGTSLSAQARYAAGVREILEDFFAGRPTRQE
ncbi:MAG: NAD(P)-dependent oxidoreductase [Acidimicrobiales bacterium]